MDGHLSTPTHHLDSLNWYTIPIQPENQGSGWVTLGHSRMECWTCSCTGLLSDMSQIFTWPLITKWHNEFREVALNQPLYSSKWGAPSQLLDLKTKNLTEWLWGVLWLWLELRVVDVQDCCQTWPIPPKGLTKHWGTMGWPASTPTHHISSMEGAHLSPLLDWNPGAWLSDSRVQWHANWVAVLHECYQTCHISAQGILQPWDTLCGSASTQNTSFHTLR